jgi:glycosyltransferase involved in cell wall biosynthesis
VSPSPSVSVLLPVRDGEPTLGSALRSVARQRAVDFECVVVLDGCRDESGRIADEIAREDSRFRIVAAPRVGLVAALQTGLAHCRGALVARMDADDVMHRDRLAWQARALGAHPDWDGVGCHVRLFPRSALTDGMRAYEAWLRSIDGPEAVRREAFVECPIPHPTLMLRRPVLAEAGYRDEGWPEDYDLVLRLLGEGRTLGMVPRRLLAWREGPSRLSRLHPAYAIARFVACKAAFLAEGPLAKEPGYVLWGYGRTGRTLRAALALHGKRPSRIVELHPGRLGQRIHEAEVVPPSWLSARTSLPLVVSVAGAGPRAEIRGVLAGYGYLEGRDFWCAA